MLCLPEVTLNLATTLTAAVHLVHKGVQFAMQGLIQAMQRSGLSMINTSINSTNKPVHSVRNVRICSPTA